MNHEAVLLHEVIAGLDLQPGLTVLDGTLGDGGHARAIGELIGATGRLIGLDADPEAVVRAGEKLADLASAKLFRSGNFRDLDSHLSALGIDRLDRALLDLGL